MGLRPACAFPLALSAPRPRGGEGIPCPRIRLTRPGRACSTLERSMERQVERDLEILTAIEEGRPLTQRALAERLGVALGLANLYLKRLARKGCIKIVEFPKKPAARKRLRYLLTPRGVAEKTRLTY